MNKSVFAGAIGVMIVLILATIILRSPSEGPKGGVDTSYDAAGGGAYTGGVNVDTGAADSVSVTASVGQPVVVDKLTLTVLSIVEESRCPSDVQCIQAGRVRAEVKIVSSSETSTSVIEPSTTIAAAGYSVSLVSVLPYPNTKVPLTASDYRLNFVISSR